MLDIFEYRDPATISQCGTKPAATAVAFVGREVCYKRLGLDLHWIARIKMVIDGNHRPKNARVCPPSRSTHDKRTYAQEA
jgi:hypothetical protein